MVQAAGGRSKNLLAITARIAAVQVARPSLGPRKRAGMKIDNLERDRGCRSMARLRSRRAMEAPKTSRHPLPTPRTKTIPVAPGIPAGKRLQRAPIRRCRFSMLKRRLVWPSPRRCKFPMTDDRPSQRDEAVSCSGRDSKRPRRGSATRVSGSGCGIRRPPSAWIAANPGAESKRLETSGCTASRRRRGGGLRLGCLAHSALDSTHSPFLGGFTVEMARAGAKTPSASPGAGRGAEASMRTKQGEVP